MESTYLGAIFGWVLIVLSFHFLFKLEHMRSVMADVNMHPGLFFVFSMITLVFGLMVVINHNTWVMDWQVIVTLLGWIILVNSLIRLLFPDTAMRVGRSFFNYPVRMRVVGVVLFIMGLIILYHVYYPYLVTIY